MKKKIDRTKHLLRRRKLATGINFNALDGATVKALVKAGQDFIEYSSHKAASETRLRIRRMISKMLMDETADPPSVVVIECNKLLRKIDEQIRKMPARAKARKGGL